MVGLMLSALIAASFADLGTAVTQVSHKSRIPADERSSGPANDRAIRVETDALHHAPFTQARAGTVLTRLRTGHTGVNTLLVIIHLRTP